ncbi:putative C8orf59-like protein, partial [Naja naja]
MAVVVTVATSPAGAEPLLALGHSLPTAHLLHLIPPESHQLSSSPLSSSYPQCNMTLVCLTGWRRWRRCREANTRLGVKRGADQRRRRRQEEEEYDSSRGMVSQSLMHLLAESEEAELRLHVDRLPDGVLWVVKKSQSLGGSGLNIVSRL